MRGSHVFLREQVHDSSIGHLRFHQPREACVDVRSRLLQQPARLLQRLPGAGTEICIPQQCDIYQVAPFDTCASVAKAKNITIAQLVEYNPNLNSVCGNLPALIGYVICVSPLGEVTMTAKPARTTTS